MPRWSVFSFYGQSAVKHIRWFANSSTLVIVLQLCSPNVQWKHDQHPPISAHTSALQPRHHQPTICPNPLPTRRIGHWSSTGFKKQTEGATKSEMDRNTRSPTIHTAGKTGLVATGLTLGESYSYLRSALLKREGARLGNTTIMAR